MSVPVVPSKAADPSALDGETELTWPPPEDPRFALDVMDLQTRRVMTTEDAAKELCPPGDPLAPVAGVHQDCDLSGRDAL